MLSKFWQTSSKPNFRKTRRRKPRGIVHRPLARSVEPLEPRTMLAADANFMFDPSIESSFHFLGITPANQDVNPSLLIDPPGPNSGYYLQANPFLPNGGSVDVASTAAGFGAALKFAVDGSPVTYSAAQGDKVFDLIGTPHEGALNQIIESVPGEMYGVTFSLSSNQENEVDNTGRLIRHSDRKVNFWWNNQLIDQLDAPDMGEWRQYTYLLQATSTTTKVGFGGVATPNSRVATGGVVGGIPYQAGDPIFGPLLDDVNVVTTIDARNDATTTLPENYFVSSFSKNVVANDRGGKQISSAQIVSRSTNDPGGFPVASYGSIGAINVPAPGLVTWDGAGPDPLNSFEFLGVGEYAEEVIEYEIRSPAAYASPSLGLPDYPNGARDSAQWRVRITGQNDDPLARDDSYMLDEDTVLTVNAPGVLVNDGDVDGDPLTAAIVSGPSHGQLILDADGAFRYTPDENFHGDDAFVYQVNDGYGGTAQATATILVKPIDDDLVVDAGEDQATFEGTMVSFAGSFVDPDGGAHSVQWDFGDGSPVASGTLSPHHVFADDGVYVVTLRVTDAAGDSASDTLRVTVGNLAPEILSSEVNAAMFCGVEAEQPVTVSVGFRDAGFDHDVAGTVFDTAEDFVASTIDWGDGTVSALPAISVIENAGSPGVFTTGIVQGSHAYATGGVYTVTVTVTDDDGGQDEVTLTAMTSGVGVVDGTLYVIGTDGADRITINRQGRNRFKVHANFLSSGNFVTVDGSAVEKIVVHTCGGDDHLTVAGNIRLPLLANLGDGNDHANAGGGPSILVGGAGADHLNGGSARDVLIGGTGSDRLVGGKGQDLLIAGYTAYDDNDTALLSLLDDWNSTDGYATRVRKLRSGTGGSGLRLASGVTVFEDDAPDRLTGGAGRDWFFFDLQDDQATDKKRRERGN